MCFSHPMLSQQEASGGHNHVFLLPLEEHLVQGKHLWLFGWIKHQGLGPTEFIRGVRLKVKRSDQRHREHREAQTTDCLSHGALLCSEKEMASGMFSLSISPFRNHALSPTPKGKTQMRSWLLAGYLKSGKTAKLSNRQPWSKLQGNLP